MTRALDAGRRAPASGRTGQVVVFLHGYGADGNDLLGLAEPLAPHMPDTVFLAPNAPERCTVNPMGYQWFPIPWIDGSSEEEAATGMQAAGADLDAYLDGVLADEGITPDRLTLVGFSQGTMMALHVAPRRVAPVAGIVGFSGRLMQPDLLADEVVSRPPVLLLHGDQDDVVPPQSLPEAANALTGAGFEVFAHVMKGTAHGIAPDGLSVALAFMRDRLGLEAG
ncbi:alpha/beta hydrolase [Meridianimarinicoccus sp. RP-17]|uniref:alpha/beta hydrolase n=1 Tax=Meridianimarinicoccus zhengii TaxID=2056810 RepID=UPI000DACB0C4|nr:dienelactone hydrolase family protein [Phycocomes zhengii]